MCQRLAERERLARVWEDTFLTGSQCQATPASAGLPLVALADQLWLIATTVLAQGIAVESGDGDGLLRYQNALVKVVARAVSSEATKLFGLLMTVLPLPLAPSEGAPL